MGNKITRRRPTIDERYTRPQGLYPYRDVDQRKLRRLILDSKLAPCFPGGEDPAADSEECPICFLHYPSLNRSKCCSKGICTECFLQMKSPHVARATQCPFCKTANYAVEFRGAKTQEEKGVEQAEEQKVIEAKIRMREQERLEDHERELRREEDIREGRITPRPQVLLEREHLIRNAPLDEIERINRQSGWGNVGHLPPQAPMTSLQLDRPTLGVVPDSLWARRGGFVSEGGVDAAAPPQQSIVPSIPNHLPPSNQQHSGMQMPAPAPPPGAHIIQQPPSGFARNRDDEFDFDLEDIMVMEAIWLSIQDEGARHRYGETDLPQSAPSRLPASINDYQVDPEFVPLPPPPPPLPSMEGRDQCPGRWGVTGGLAGAIAALAERQVASGDVAPAAAQQTIFNLNAPQSEVENRISDEMESSSPTEMLSAEEVFDNDGPVSRSLSLNDGVSEETLQRTGEGDLHAMADAVAGGSETENDARNSTRASEGLSDWVSSTQREYMGASMNNWSGDQSSEQVEVGTSFSSSIPSASELPWEAPDISAAGGNGESSGGGDNGGKVMLPESYEEQMMLAMALSLADAQSRVRQGDSNSGALAQHAQD